MAPSKLCRFRSVGLPVACGRSLTRIDPDRSSTEAIDIGRGDQEYVDGTYSDMVVLEKELASWSTEAAPERSTSESELLAIEARKEEVVTWLDRIVLPSEAEFMDAAEDAASSASGIFKPRLAAVANNRSSTESSVSSSCKCKTSVRYRCSSIDGNPGAWPPA